MPPPIIPDPPCTPNPDACQGKVCGVANDGAWPGRDRRAMGLAMDGSGRGAAISALAGVRGLGRYDKG